MLTDFLHFDDVAVTRHRPSGCIGELIAVPTAPRSVAKRVQLIHSAPAFTDKIESLATKPPRGLLRSKNLVREVDKPVVPRCRPNAQIIRLVAPLPPVTCGLADIASPPDRANIDDSGLFYRSAPAVTTAVTSIGRAVIRRWSGWGDAVPAFTRPGFFFFAPRRSRKNRAV